MREPRVIVRNALIAGSMLALTAPAFAQIVVTPFTCSTEEKAWREILAGAALLSSFEEPEIVRAVANASDRVLSLYDTGRMNMTAEERGTEACRIAQEMDDEMRRLLRHR